MNPLPGPDPRMAPARWAAREPRRHNGLKDPGRTNNTFMENKTAKTLWTAFLEQFPEYASAAEPRTDHFGDTEDIANSCLELVLKGKKQATSHSLLGLQLRGEPLPKIGDLTIITDWEGQARCIIRTAKVTLKPYFKVGPADSRLEGEGDGSLEYWRESHRAYYSRELAPFGRVPSDSMIVVFEVFDCLFPEP